MNVLRIFAQLSSSIDDGSVFKAAFQTPSRNRQSNFTVKFTPQFGTLARPKKNINTKISSMVFGQAQTEMVMAHSKTAPTLCCAVFYGAHCKPEIAAALARKLIDGFSAQFA